MPKITVRDAKQADNLMRLKVKCGSCGRRAHVRNGYFLKNGGRTHQYIGCCFKDFTGQGRCRGHMTRVPGSRLVGPRSNTLRELAPYEKALIRGERPARILRATPIDYSGPDLDPDDQREIEAQERRDALLDTDFEPAVEFNPAMRFTVNNAAPRNPLAMTRVDKSIGPVQIGGMRMDQRLISTKSKMGGVPAWRLARNSHAPNASAWQLGSQNHYEYCHLQGCALGGSTVASNLVAGHYALNTCMMVIENRLQAKTNLWIEVNVTCSSPDVAERLEYKVLSNTSGTPVLRWSMVIDGTTPYFSATDKDEVEQSMRHAGL